MLANTDSLKLAAVAFSLGTCLDIFGLAATFFHSHHASNHVSYLAALCLFSLATSSMAAACFLVYDTLAQLAPNRGTNKRTWPTLVAPVLLIIGTFSTIFKLLGLYDYAIFLSPAQIDGMRGAMDRLAHEERAKLMLGAGEGMQVCSLLLCFIACVVAAVPWLKAPAQLMGRKRMFCVLLALVSLLFVPSVTRCLWYADVIKLDFNIVEAWAGMFWVCEALPQMLAISLYFTTMPDMFATQQCHELPLYSRSGSSNGEVSDEKGELLINVW